MKFKTREECEKYINERINFHGSNLIGWTKKIDGYFVPCFNVYN